MYYETRLINHKKNSRMIWKTISMKYSTDGLRIIPKYPKLSLKLIN